MDEHELLEPLMLAALRRCIDSAKHWRAAAEDARARGALTTARILENPVGAVNEHVRHCAAAATLDACASELEAHAAWIDSAVPRQSGG